MIDTLISFGSNLGGSEKIVSHALELLDSHPQIDGLCRSSLMRTKPIGGPAGQPDFINGVARFTTTLRPNELMHFLLETERHFGRERRIRWDARVLDLDILLLGSEIRFDKDCVVPHPRMTFRPFALEPATEIAADMVHPICGIPLSDLFSKLRDAKRAIKFIGDFLKFETVTQNLISKYPDWSFLHQSVFDFENEFKGDSNAKLTIFLLEQESIPQFLTKKKIEAGYFSNPLLILEAADFESIETEVIAAIAAINELD